MKYLGLFGVVVGLFVSTAFAAPADFNAAKKVAQRIYADETEDFYCGCPLRWVAGKGQLNLKSCGYQVRKNGPRAQRVEWEHVVPAHQFGHRLSCWQQGGRALCGEQDSQFRKMEADLFNLRPANGEVNGDRAHFQFAELPQVPARHGACPVRIDFGRQLAEPRPAVRGDIARIYFYMADRYQLTLSAAQQALFLRWHEADPVDARERLLMQRTAQQMGHANEFVTGQKIWYQGYLTERGQPTTESLPTGAAVGAQARAAHHQVTANQKGDNLLVRANKNSKKYHLPHCPGYHLIKADNVVSFSQERQARQAGYQKAGNCRD